jgi:hypothetical protein
MNPAEHPTPNLPLSRLRVPNGTWTCIVRLRDSDRSIALRYFDLAPMTCRKLSSPLVYRWRKNGTPLTDGGNISGVLTDSLTISNVAAGDAGSYPLVVTNSRFATNNAVPHTTETWDGTAQPGGGQETSQWRTFDGSIDEVAIFNNAISPCLFMPAGSRKFSRVKVQ